MPYSIDQLSNLVDQLTARLNAVDGQNLAEPATGVLPAQAKQIAGLRTDLNQSILNMENILNGFKNTLISYVNLLRGHLGLAPLPNS